MSISTDAILFFGIADSGETWTVPFGRYDWKNYYAAKIGHPEPTIPYEQNKEIHQKQWEEQRRLVEECPFEINYHCCQEAPYLYVAIKSTIQKANRGDVLEVNLNQPNKLDSLLVQFKEFCEMMGIPYSDPKWLMVSYWG